MLELDIIAMHSILDFRDVDLSLVTNFNISNSGLEYRKSYTFDLQLDCEVRNISEWAFDDMPNLKGIAIAFVVSATQSELLSCSCLEKLTSLKKIDLSYYNDGNAIPVEMKAAKHDLTFGVFTHLTYLRLIRFEVDIDMLKHLTSLETVALIKCKLFNLKATNFAQKKKLKVLTISDCNLEEIEQNLFAQLSGLEILCLSSNRLTNLHADIFKGLPELDTLQLQENRLAVIEPSWFTEKPKLKVVRIENNQLTHLDTRWFATNKKLRYLNKGKIN